MTNQLADELEAAGPEELLGTDLLDRVISALRRSDEPKASSEGEWMPDCTCGRDPKFFRHDSQCPLRYWHELRAVRTEPNREGGRHGG